MTLAEKSLTRIAAMERSCGALQKLLYGKAKEVREWVTLYGVPRSTRSNASVAKVRRKVVCAGHHHIDDAIRIE